MQDLTARYLAGAEASLPADVVGKARSRGRDQDLRRATAALLERL